MKEVHMQISVKNVTYRYFEDQKEAVNDVSFDIEKGSYTTIIGHNGSGKSTIAKLLVGLLEANEGTITIEDKLLTEENVTEIRDIIAIVFQNPDNQFIGSTVRDDIAFGLENHSVAPKDMDPIIETFAELVDMTSFLYHEPTKLSGGQKQRVAIAGVLAMKPDILILDEATAMLDPKGKKEVMDLVRKIHQDEKMTIISITHDIEEVNFSDQVIVMNEGQITFNGNPSEILTQQKVLTDIQLDVPFSVKLATKLKDKGIPIENMLDEGKIIDELWQYNLKK